MDASFFAQKSGGWTLFRFRGLLFSVCHRRQPCRAIGIAVKAATSMARSCFRKSGRMSWLREMECFPSGNFGTSCQSPSLAALFRLPSYEKTCPVTRFRESQPTYCIVEIFPSRNILFFFRSAKSVQAIFSFLPILYSPLSPPLSRPILVLGYKSYCLLLRLLSLFHSKRIGIFYALLSSSSSFLSSCLFSGERELLCFCCGGACVGIRQSVYGVSPHVGNGSLCLQIFQSPQIK